MSKLQIGIVTNNPHGFYMTANGEEVMLKKKGGMLIGEVETEQPTVDVNITRYADVGGVLWFLMQIVFFIISFFGLFDRGKRTAAAFTANYTIDASTDRRVSFRIKAYNKYSPYREGDKAMEEVLSLGQTTSVVSEGENKYYMNESYNKKLKLLKTVKILLFLAILAVAIVAIIKAIIG